MTGHERGIACAEMAQAPGECASKTDIPRWQQAPASGEQQGICCECAQAISEKGKMSSS